MSEAREVLQEIRRRAHDASLAGVGDGPLAWTMRNAPNRVVSPLVTDLNRSVAALTAVLDRHAPVDWPGMGIPGLANRTLCGECSDEQGIDYPCPTVSGITAALGADHA